MNETIRQINDRKSCRSFEQQDISREMKEMILNAAIQAPTAGNMTLYTILDITDQKLKDRLSQTCDHQEFIAYSPMVLVFCADYHRWYESFKRNMETVRKPGAGDLMLAVDDTLIAAQNSVVAAESLGISSCYIGDILENYEIHRELLKLPEYVVPACMICYGIPSKLVQNRRKPPRFKVEDIVHENVYAEEKSMRMDEMLAERQGLVDKQEFKKWIQAFCTRKWNSDFSIEMSRSVEAMIEDWNE